MKVGPLPRKLLGAFLVATSFASLPALPAPSISAGGVHTLAVGTDGRVRAWGDDSAGELGSGRPIVAATPLNVPGLPAAVAIAAGGTHNLAITTAGTVWAWGSNYYGELGDGGTAFSRPFAAPVLDLTDIISIAVGGTISAAVRRDGTVWLWGYVDGGPRSRPAQVGGLQGVRALAVGSSEHILALREDGTVWAWGFNRMGEIGNGTTDPVTAPVPVAGLANVIAVAAGYEMSLALKSDGTVWAWGSNDAGQLGDGTNSMRTRPVRVESLGDVAAIAAGARHGVALRRDGSLWAWGGDAFASFEGMSTMVPFPLGFTSVVAIASGSLPESLVAIRADGSAWTWATPLFGQITNPTPHPHSAPARIANPPSVVAAAAGSDHAALLSRDGGVWTFGSNHWSQLGDGAASVRTAPFRVPGLEGVLQVAAGYGLSIALTSDGSVWGFGNNGQGQLADGTLTDKSVPTRVAGIGGVIAISAGLGHVVAVRSDGTVWTWGYDNLGQLGRLGPRGTPAQVSGITDVVAVSAGEEFTLALKRDGTVWAWGGNQYGQLGDRVFTSRSTPAQVPGVTEVVAISAGSDNALLLRRDGTVWTTKERPARVEGLPSVVAVSMGYSHAAVLASDGTIWTWGTNRVGELGDGTRVDRTTPAPVAGVRNALAVGASGPRNYLGSGNGQTVALLQDGTVLSWGSNFFGQLGDGTLADRLVPVAVINEAGAGSLSGNDWFLDLDAASAGSVAAEQTPPFLLLATRAGQNVTAAIRYRSEDVGSVAGTFVFAMAPANIVKRADEATVLGKSWRPGIGKDGEVACVLAQLNAAGELVGVNAAQLQAFLSGVLTAQGASLSILGSVPVGNIAGSTFFVGYGPNGQLMLTRGLNRSVVTMPGERECKPQVPKTGWWWNPREDGRGFSIEVRGRNVFFASFLYDVDGRSNWYVSSGPVSLDGSLYLGDLLGARGGQTLGGSYPGFPALTNVGPLTLAFDAPARGTLSWPGGTVPIERMSFIPDGLSLPAAAGVPESGWWWNESEAGRGFFLEFQGSWLDIAGYMYDDSGNPVWYLTVAEIGGSAASRTFSGNWWSFTGGQTLTGAWRQNTRSNSNVAPLTITFTSLETAVMTLPNNRTTSLRRHRF